MAINNYVKFQRGSQAAYDLLKQSSQLDKNTLYFIYPEKGSSVGSLYLGDKIISGGDIVLESASLNDLKDVNLAGLQDGDLLVYNSESSTWKPVRANSLIPDVAPANVFQVAPQAEETDTVAIKRVVGETAITAGDISIVKRAITEKYFSYTAYVYNGADWAAMDGNYDAANVYFGQDLMTTHAIGNISLNAGQGTANVKGQNLIDAWNTIFVKEKTPTITKPNCSISGISLQYLEIGTSGTQTATVGYEDGRYEYGYANGVTIETAGEDKTPAPKGTTNNGVTNAAATTYHLSYNGVPVSGENDTFVVNSGIETTAVTKSVTATVDYGEGSVPVSNVKKMYPSMAITPGTTSEVNKNAFAWYIPMYKGFKLTSNVITNPKAITAEEVQGLDKITDSEAYNKTVPTTATASGAWRQYFIAVPESYKKNKPSVLDSNNLPLTVEEANNITISYGSASIEYKVWFISLADAYDTLSISIKW